MSSLCQSAHQLCSTLIVVKASPLSRMPELGRTALSELWGWNLSFGLGQGPFPGGWGAEGEWSLLHETGQMSQEIEAR